MTKSKEYLEVWNKFCLKFNGLPSEEDAFETAWLSAKEIVLNIINQDSTLPRSLFKRIEKL